MKSHTAGFRTIRLKLRENGDKLYQGLFLEAHRRIVLRTPVDTGRARGNWLVEAGETMPQGTRDTLDPNGTAAMSEATSFVPKLKLGMTSWIINNLPYIERLENGWSRQAPAGMVAVTHAEITQIAETIIRRTEAGR